jgi:hypothetical protein
VEDGLGLPVIGKRRRAPEQYGIPDAGSILETVIIGRKVAGATMTIMDGATIEAMTIIMMMVAEITKDEA